MLSESFVATGWHVDSAPKTVEDYCRAAEIHYGLKPSSSVKRFARELVEGDFVWIIDVSGLYHLARITGPWSYVQDGRSFGVYAVNRYACHWIASNLSAADTSSGVRNALMQGGAFCRVKDAASISHTARLAGEAVGADQQSVLELIGHDALEDLVGLFLQIALDAVLVPSSSKQSTAAYEFVLKRRDGTSDIVAQVKSGQASITDNLSAVPCTRYLFSLSGQYPEDLNGANVIARAELETFMLQHRELLPGTIRCWLH
ncbi:MAG TPA: hypothetical protein DCY26_04190 [Hyphomonas sp.]|nr:hypothetical protein [Hyphomonas sp.]